MSNNKPLADELYIIGQRVKSAYAQCLVYEDALEYCNIDDELRKELEDNKYYWADIQRIEFEAKSLLTATLHSIIQTGKPSEQLQAVKALGEVIYPERFGKVESKDSNNVRIEFYIPENNRKNVPVNASTSQRKP